MHLKAERNMRRYVPVILVLLLVTIAWKQTLAARVKALKKR
jgi:hypothetical protein